MNALQDTHVSTELTGSFGLSCSWVSMLTGLLQEEVTRRGKREKRWGKSHVHQELHELHSDVAYSTIFSSDTHASQRTPLKGFLFKSTSYLYLQVVGSYCICEYE